MNKHLLYILLCFIFIIKAFPQAVSVNSDDPFYTEIVSWEMNGYIDKLPRLRPYPVNLIKSILMQAMDAPNAKVRERANYYYEKFFTKTWSISAQVGGIYKYYNKDFSHYDDSNKNTAINYDKKYAYINPKISGSFELTPLIGFCYDVGVYSRKNDELLPYYTNSNFDCIFDAAETGPLYSYLDANMAASIGQPDMYIQLGIYRTGYGPFNNAGFALNDSAFHSANIAFTIMRNKWNYSQQLSSIGATNMMGDIDKLTYGKFMAFHALEYRLLKCLSVSYYETVVFGRRFEFSYLTPIMYMVAQNLSGANDNLQMGLLFEWQPFHCIKWISDIFIDDYSVDDFVKFNADAKYRFGIKTGFVISPFDSGALLTIDYTIQSPYLYAHWDYEDASAKYVTFDYSTINYQNYTNAGLPIGSTLPPNSDKISFTATFHPLRAWTLNIMTNYIRHTNICQSYNDEDAWYMLTHTDIKSDGSLYTTQIKNPNGEHIEAAWEHLNLLSQGESMKILQLGIASEVNLYRKAYRGWSIKCSYTFEYVVNAGVDNLIYSPEPSRAKLLDDASLNQWQKDYIIHKEVSRAVDLWKQSFHDDRNHYFNFSLKYAF